MPEEGQPQGGTQPQGGEEGTPEEPFDAERAKATIQTQRESEKAAKAEARIVKKQLDEALAKLKDIEDKDKSETERLTARVSELEQEVSKKEARMQEIQVRSAVISSATEAGARYPDAVWKLVDAADVEFDDAGTPKNASKLVEQIKGAYPEMFGTPIRSIDQGPQGGSPSDDPNKVFMDLLKQ